MALLPKAAPSWRYKDIFEKYYEKKYKEQQDTLMNIAYQFLAPREFFKEKGLLGRLKSIAAKDYFSKKSKIEAIISPFHIERLSRAYFIDIIRYKEYHYNPKKEDVSYEDYVKEIHSGEDMQRLGPDKIAAYLVKWIVKAQPIQVEIPEDAELKDPQLSDRIWYVNTYYALLVACEFLEFSIGTIDKKFRLDLIHHIRFRAYDENSLVLLFRTMKDVYK